MKIAPNRLWMAGGALACILMLVAGWFLLIQPKRAEAVDTRLQTESVQQSNEQLRVRIAQLKAQFATLPAKQRQLEEVRRAMPQDIAESTLLREVQALASGTGSTLVSVTSGELTPLGSAASAPAAASPSASSTATASASAGGTTAGAAPVGEGLVQSLPVTIVVDAPFASSQAFLQQLQNKMPRAFLVTDLQITARKPGEKGGGKPLARNGDVEVTVKGMVFVLNADQPASAGAAASTPTAATTPTSSVTATATASAVAAN